MKANSWLYHYYMVQSRLQYNLAYGGQPSAIAALYPQMMHMMPSPFGPAGPFDPFPPHHSQAAAAAAEAAAFQQHNGGGGYHLPPEGYAPNHYSVS